MTVDRCAALFPSGSDVPCNLQYVAATRGREENHLLYACPDKDSRELDHRLTGAQTDPERIAEARMLAAMLSHSDTLTATETANARHGSAWTSTASYASTTTPRD